MLSRRTAAAFVLFCAAFFATLYVVPVTVAHAADLKCSEEKAYDTPCGKDQIGKDGKPTGKKGGVGCFCQETDETSGITTKGYCNKSVQCVTDKDAEGRDAKQCSSPGTCPVNQPVEGSGGAPATEPPSGSPEGKPAQTPTPNLPGGGSSGGGGSGGTTPKPNETPKPNDEEQAGSLLQRAVKENTTSETPEQKRFLDQVSSFFSPDSPKDATPESKATEQDPDHQFLQTQTFGGAQQSQTNVTEPVPEEKSFWQRTKDYWSEEYDKSFFKTAVVEPVKEYVVEPVKDFFKQDVPEFTDGTAEYFKDLARQNGTDVPDTPTEEELRAQYPQPTQDVVPTEEELRAQYPGATVEDEESIREETKGIYTLEDGYVPTEAEVREKAQLDNAVPYLTAEQKLSPFNADPNERPKEGAWDSGPLGSIMNTKVGFDYTKGQLDAAVAETKAAEAKFIESNDNLAVQESRLQQALQAQKDLITKSGGTITTDENGKSTFTFPNNTAPKGFDEAFKESEKAVESARTDAKEALALAKSDFAALQEKAGVAKDISSRLQTIAGTATGQFEVSNKDVTRQSSYYGSLNATGDELNRLAQNPVGVDPQTFAKAQEAMANAKSSATTAIFDAAAGRPVDPQSAADRVTAKTLVENISLEQSVNSTKQEIALLRQNPVDLYQTDIPAPGEAVVPVLTEKGEELARLEKDLERTEQAIKNNNAMLGCIQNCKNPDGTPLGPKAAVALTDPNIPQTQKDLLRMTMINSSNSANSGATAAATYEQIMAKGESILVPGGGFNGEPVFISPHEQAAPYQDQAVRDAENAAAAARSACELSYSCTMSDETRRTVLKASSNDLQDIGYLGASSNFLHNVANSEGSKLVTIPAAIGATVVDDFGKTVALAGFDTKTPTTMVQELSMSDRAKVESNTFAVANTVLNTAIIASPAMRAFSSGLRIMAEDAAVLARNEIIGTAAETFAADTTTLGRTTNNFLGSTALSGYETGTNLGNAFDNVAASFKPGDFSGSFSTGLTDLTKQTGTVLDDVRAAGDLGAFGRGTLSDFGSVASRGDDFAGAYKFTAPSESFASELSRVEKITGYAPPEASVPSLAGTYGQAARDLAQADYAAAQEAAFEAAKTQAMQKEAMAYYSNAQARIEEANARAQAAFKQAEQEYANARTTKDISEAGPMPVPPKPLLTSTDLTNARATLDALGVEALGNNRFLVKETGQVFGAAEEAAATGGRASEVVAGSGRGAQKFDEVTPMALRDVNAAVVKGLPEESRLGAENSVRFFERTVATSKMTPEGLAPSVRSLRELGLTPTEVGSEVRAMTAAERAAAKAGDADVIAQRMLGDATHNAARDSAGRSIEYFSGTTRPANVTSGQLAGAWAKQVASEIGTGLKNTFSPSNFVESLSGLSPAKVLQGTGNLVGESLRVTGGLSAGLTGQVGTDIGAALFKPLPAVTQTANTTRIAETVAQRFAPSQFAAEVSQQSLIKNSVWAPRVTMDAVGPTAESIASKFISPSNVFSSALPVTAAGTFSTGANAAPIVGVVQPADVLRVESNGSESFTPSEVAQNLPGVVPSAQTTASQTGITPAVESTLPSFQKWGENIIKNLPGSISPFSSAFAATPNNPGALENAAKTVQDSLGRLDTAAKGFEALVAGAPPKPDTSKMSPIDAGLALTNWGVQNVAYGKEAAGKPEARDIAAAWGDFDKVAESFTKAAKDQALSKGLRDRLQTLGDQTTDFKSKLPGLIKSPGDAPQMVQVGKKLVTDITATAQDLAKEASALAAKAAPSKPFAIAPDAVRPPVVVQSGGSVPANIAAPALAPTKLFPNKPSVASAIPYSPNETKGLMDRYWLTEPNIDQSAAVKILPPRPVPYTGILPKTGDPLFAKSIKDMTDDELKAAINKSADALQNFWKEEFKKNGGEYRLAEIKIIDSKDKEIVGSGFEPGVGVVELDLEDFRLKYYGNKGATGIYVSEVVAHELGHYVTRILGVVNKASSLEIFKNIKPPLSAQTGYDRKTLSELQADYLAGVALKNSGLLTEGDPERIYYSAAGDADDIGWVITGKTGTFSHGSAVDRAQAVYQGLTSGDVTTGLSMLGPSPDWKLASAGVPWSKVTEALVDSTKAHVALAPAPTDSVPSPVAAKPAPEPTLAAIPPDGGVTNVKPSTDAKPPITEAEIIAALKPKPATVPAAKPIVEAAPTVAPAAPAAPAAAPAAPAAAPVVPASVVTTPKEVARFGLNKLNAADTAANKLISGTGPLTPAHLKRLDNGTKEILEAAKSVNTPEAQTLKAQISKALADAKASGVDDNMDISSFRGFIRGELDKVSNPARELAKLVIAANPAAAPAATGPAAAQTLGVRPVVPKISSTIAPGKQAGIVSNITNPDTATIVYGFYGIGGAIDTTGLSYAQQFLAAKTNGVLIIPDVGTAPGRMGGGTAGALGTAEGAKAFDAEMAAAISSATGISADKVAAMKRAVVFHSGGFSPSNAMLLGLGSKVSAVQSLDGMYPGAPEVLLSWMKSNPNATLTALCSSTCESTMRLSSALSNAGITVNNNINAISKGVTIGRAGAGHSALVAFNSPVQNFLGATAARAEGTVLAASGKVAPTVTLAAIGADVPAAVTAPVALAKALPGFRPASEGTAAAAASAPVAPASVSAPVSAEQKGAIENLFNTMKNIGASNAVADLTAAQQKLTDAGVTMKDSGNPGDPGRFASLNVGGKEVARIYPTTGVSQQARLVYTSEAAAPAAPTAPSAAVPTTLAPGERIVNVKLPGNTLASYISQKGMSQDTFERVALEQAWLAKYVGNGTLPADTGVGHYLAKLSDAAAAPRPVSAMEAVKTIKVDLDKAFGCSGKACELKEIGYGKNSNIPEMYSSLFKSKLALGSASNPDGKAMASIMKATIGAFLVDPAAFKGIYINSAERNHSGVGSRRHNSQDEDGASRAFDFQGFSSQEQKTRFLALIAAFLQEDGFQMNLGVGGDVTHADADGKSVSPSGGNTWCYSGCAGVTGILAELRNLIGAARPITPEFLQRVSGDSIVTPARTYDIYKDGVLVKRGVSLPDTVLQSSGPQSLAANLNTHPELSNMLGAGEKFIVDGDRILIQKTTGATKPAFNSLGKDYLGESLRTRGVNFAPDGRGGYTVDGVGVDLRMIKPTFSNAVFGLGNKLDAATAAQLPARVAEAQGKFRFNKDTDKALVFGIFAQETKGLTNERSPANAYGIGQTTMVAARDLFESATPSWIRDYFVKTYGSPERLMSRIVAGDVQASVDATVGELSNLRYRYGLNDTGVIAAYNGGPTRGRNYVNGSGFVPAETADYVPKVQRWASHVTNGQIPGNQTSSSAWAAVMHSMRNGGMTTIPALSGGGGPGGAGGGGGGGAGGGNDLVPGGVGADGPAFDPNAQYQIVDKNGKVIGAVIAGTALVGAPIMLVSTDPDTGEPNGKQQVTVSDKAPADTREVVLAEKPDGTPHEDKDGKVVAMDPKEIPKGTWDPEKKTYTIDTNPPAPAVRDPWAPGGHADPYGRGRYLGDGFGRQFAGGAPTGGRNSGGGASTGGTNARTNPPRRTPSYPAPIPTPLPVPPVTPVLTAELSCSPEQAVIGRDTKIEIRWSCVTGTAQAQGFSTGGRAIGTTEIVIPRTATSSANFRVRCVLNQNSGDVAQCTIPLVPNADESKDIEPTATSTQERSDRTTGAKREVTDVVETTTNIEYTPPTESDEATIDPLPEQPQRQLEIPLPNANGEEEPRPNEVSPLPNQPTAVQRVGAMLTSLKNGLLSFLSRLAPKK